ncbi:MAG: hypothetical protein ACI3VR_01370 [Intestinibacter sp.]|uniref:hypothetical protein n=1 Tax=Intestinibacter sp. TaxID=1965304 RepID=UPI003F17B9D5
MIDLREFYLSNIKENEYYYFFYELVLHVNEQYNIFDDEICETEHDFKVFDIEEAIEKFKTLCFPENEYHDNEKKCWFYIILYYLFKNGYIIEEFPKLINRPPRDSYDFVNKEIRNRIILQGKDHDGTVRYKDRRFLVTNLTFSQVLSSHVELDSSLEIKFQEISTRQASFQNMSTDEKLAEIANLIENLLKDGKKFINLDYSLLCFSFIDDAKIKEYRNKLHCFRHSSPQSLEERKSYSNEQKVFFVDYGITILNAIHTLKSKNL